MWHPIESGSIHPLVSSGQDNNIVGGKKTASRELPLTPDASTRLPREGSSTLDGLRSFNRQTLGHVESNESIGIDITVGQRFQPSQESPNNPHNRMHTPRNC